MMNKLIDNFLCSDEEENAVLESCSIDSKSLVFYDTSIRLTKSAIIDSFQLTNEYQNVTCGTVVAGIAFFGG